MLLNPFLSPGVGQTTRTGAQPMFPALAQQNQQGPFGAAGKPYGMMGQFPQPSGPFGMIKPPQPPPQPMVPVQRKMQVTNLPQPAAPPPGGTVQPTWQSGGKMQYAASGGTVLPAPPPGGTVQPTWQSGGKMQYAASGGTVLPAPPPTAATAPTGPRFAFGQVPLNPGYSQLGAIPAGMTDRIPQIYSEIANKPVSWERWGRIPPNLDEMVKDMMADRDTSPLQKSQILARIQYESGNAIPSLPQVNFANGQYSWAQPQPQAGGAAGTAGQTGQPGQPAAPAPPGAPAPTANVTYRDAAGNPIGIQPTGNVNLPLPPPSQPYGLGQVNLNQVIQNNSTGAPQTLGDLIRIANDPATNPNMSANIKRDISGAVQGGAAGYATGGPIGAAVGFVSGLLGGSSKSTPPESSLAGVGNTAIYNQLSDVVSQNLAPTPPPGATPVATTAPESIYAHQVAANMLTTPNRPLQGAEAALLSAPVGAMPIENTAQNYLTDVLSGGAVSPQSAERIKAAYDDIDRQYKDQTANLLDQLGDRLYSSGGQELLRRVEEQRALAKENARADILKQQEQLRAGLTGEALQAGNTLATRPLNVSQAAVNFATQTQNMAMQVLDFIDRGGQMNQQDLDHIFGSQGAAALRAYQNGQISKEDAFRLATLGTVPYQPYYRNDAINYLPFVPGAGGGRVVGFSGQPVYVPAMGGGTGGAGGAVSNPYDSPLFFGASDYTGGYA